MEEALLHFYVYVYLDPRKPGKFKYGEYEFEYEPFYVGKGKGFRKMCHLMKYELEQGKNKLKINKIKKIILESYTPIIIEYKNELIEKEAFELETKMIKTIGRIDLGTGPLTNMTDGGEGPTGWKHREEDKIKMAHFGNQYMLGKKATNETRQKLKIARKGKTPSKGMKHTEEWKKQHSKDMIGKMVGEKHPLYGTHRTKKQKIRQREFMLKNNPMNDEESRKKVSEKVKGNLNPMSKFVYNFISPDGEVFKNIDSLTEFCKKVQLKVITVYASIINNRRMKNGWQVQRLLKGENI